MPLIAERIFLVVMVAVLLVSGFYLVTMAGSALGLIVGVGIMASGIATARRIR